MTECSLTDFAEPINEMINADNNSTERSTENFDKSHRNTIFARLFFKTRLNENPW